MELTNIVYSSTLIFLLFLCSLFLVGFLGSQYRKLQLNFSDSRAQVKKRNFMYPAPVVISEDYNRQRSNTSTAKVENNIKFKYYDEQPVLRIKKNKSSRKTKPVSRGSLVREHYNSNSFHYSQKERNKNSIKFN